MNDPSSVSAGSDLDTDVALRLVKRAPPDAQKFLLSGFAAIALCALILTWLKSPAALVPVLLMLLVTSVCVALLSVAFNPAKTTPAAKTFLWAVMIFILSLMGLFVSAVFFGVPQSGAVAIARLFDAPELLSVDKGGVQLRVQPGEVKPVPAELLRPLDVVGKDDRFTRAQALHLRPSLVVNSGTLVVAAGPDDSAYLRVNVLDLENGTIVTNGGDVIIEANKIISGGGVLRSYVGDPAPLPSGKGRGGGHVNLIVYDRIVGKLRVNLVGGPGAAGPKGADGVAGVDGAHGEDSADHLFDCAHGAGDGGNGQPGGNGERGGRGSPGGDGGVLTVSGSRPETIQDSIQLVPNAAEGGPGGLGGAGAPGGAPGPGGSGSHYCHGGNSGVAGAHGAQGPQGPEGPAGSPARMLTKGLG